MTFCGPKSTCNRNIGSAVKLPAFGQWLMKRRFAGWHPLYVALVVGEDWSAFAQEPFVDELACLAIKPRDMKSGGGTMDLRCLAGAAVTVFDQVGAAGELDAPIGGAQEGVLTVEQEAGRAPFFYLLRDIAEWSGPLDFVTGARIYDDDTLKPPYSVSAPRYALECKLADPARAWPWWWPQSLDKAHGEKISAWCSAARARAGGAASRRRAA